MNQLFSRLVCLLGHDEYHYEASITRNSQGSFREVGCDKCQTHWTERI